MPEEKFFLQKKDTETTDPDYFLYTRKEYNGIRYVIRKTTKTGTDAVYGYYAGGVDDDADDDWTNRASLTYLDYCPYRDAELVDV